MIRFPAIPTVLVTLLMSGCQMLPSQPTKSEEDIAKVIKPETVQEEGAVSQTKPDEPIKQVVIKEKLIQTPLHIDGRLVLGVSETGFLPNHNLMIDAKMDTGAANSSIDARDFQMFERDGKKWVKFVLHRTSKGAVPMEYPVKEVIRIKRPGEESMERPVIEMTVRIGDITQQVDVSLNDRETFSFPLLIGRNFMRDLAVVDVEQHYIAKEKALKNITRKVPLTITSPEANGTRIIKKPVDTKGLETIGALEYVTFSEPGVRLKARVDTGATTSSLDARDLEVFKKNGKDWVRFNIQPPESDKPIKAEFPIARFVLIKRHGLESERRPVINMQAQIGNIKQVAEFSLRDRSSYDYPVLIGVSFLKSSAIVDVSKKYTSGSTTVEKKG